jgi:GNAT superfamily N-acetyltransferase
MWWRRKRSEWSKDRGAGNRRALRKLVESGEPPGLLAYVGSEPAAWCALAPREDYPGIGRSRLFKSLVERAGDRLAQRARPTWSVTCFYVARAHRRKGLTVRLLREAARHARSRGARLLEGYPVEPKKGLAPDAWVYTGLAAAFRKAGFREVARPSPTRPVMRRVLRG